MNLCCHYAIINKILCCASVGYSLHLCYASGRTAQRQGAAGVVNCRLGCLVRDFFICYSAIPIACIYARVGICTTEAMPTRIPDS